MSKRKTTPERDKAQAVRDRYAADVEAVRANTDLTPKARTRKIAELHSATKDQLQRLAEMDRLRLDAEMGDIDRVVFSGLRAGYGAGPEVHQGIRDALDRAAAAKTPEDAARLLDQATQYEDHALASAVAQVADRRAFESPVQPVKEAWAGVFDAYASRRTHLMGPLAEADEIHELRAAAAAPMGSPFYVPKPVEARNYEADLTRDEDDSHSYERPEPTQYAARG